jgi:hypothetical protein
MFKRVLLSHEDTLNGVCGDPRLYNWRVSTSMAMGSPETPGRANGSNLLLKQFASDVTWKLIEGQLNRWLFTPWKKWK